MQVEGSQTPWKTLSKAMENICTVEWEHHALSFSKHDNIQTMSLDQIQTCHKTLESLFKNPTNIDALLGTHEGRVLFQRITKGLMEAQDSLATNVVTRILRPERVQRETKVGEIIKLFDRAYTSFEKRHPITPKTSDRPPSTQENDEPPPTQETHV